MYSADTIGGIFTMMDRDFEKTRQALNALGVEDDAEEPEPGFIPEDFDPEEDDLEDLVDVLFSHFDGRFETDTILQILRQCEGDFDQSVELLTKMSAEPPREPPHQVSPPAATAHALPSTASVQPDPRGTNDLEELCRQFGRIFDRPTISKIFFEMCHSDFDEAFVVLDHMIGDNPTAYETQNLEPEEAALLEQVPEKPLNPLSAEFNLNPLSAEFHHSEPPQVYEEPAYTGGLEEDVRVCDPWRHGWCTDSRCQLQHWPAYECGDDPTCQDWLHGGCDDPNCTFRHCTPDPCRFGLQCRDQRCQREHGFPSDNH
ncbi:hypothetical protein Pelo_13700 [Pelomyxa schiedti]|nr:hypothetical protein Pelo_13700 [Pelomyxa schiedti]